jgi:hypothetical protein
LLVQKSPAIQAWLASDATVKNVEGAPHSKPDDAEGDLPQGGVGGGDEPLDLADLQKEIKRQWKDSSPVKDSFSTLVKPPKARDPLTEAENMAMSV